MWSLEQEIGAGSSVVCQYEWFPILNNMDEIVGGMISKFTDNTMIGSVVDSEEGVQGYNI